MIGNVDNTLDVVDLPFGEREPEVPMTEEVLVLKRPNFRMKALNLT